MKRMLLMVTALGLVATGTAQAGLVGPTLDAPYDYGSDGASNVLVTYTPYAFSSAGTVSAFQSYNQNSAYWSPGETFTVLQLRPEGGNSYQVINEQTFTTTDNLGVVTYTLSSPWSVQAGDIYAHYGQGIPIDIPARYNAPDPLYYPGSGTPSEGAVITLGGGDYPVYAQSRDYYLDANFSLASATPEPASLTLLGLGGLGLAGSGWRRRRLSVNA